MKTELFEQFYYPEGYFDFNGGNPADNTTINIWIQQCFDEVTFKAGENVNQKEFFSCISTGNTKVLLEAYRQTNGKFTCYLSVIKGYEQRSNMNIEF